MENKTKIENFEEESRLKIRNQTFSNEIDLDPYLKFNALARIIFLDLGKVFGSCDFKNCKFNNLSFRKCQFSNCRFQNCQITNSDLTCSFRNSQFLKSDLSASDFWECQFVETTFKNSNLNFRIVQDVKFRKSNKWIKIKDKSHFEKILKDTDGISSDEDLIGFYLGFRINIYLFRGIYGRRN